MKKKRLITLMAGVLVLGLCLTGIIQRTQASESSAQKKLEQNMGKLYLTEWTRVTSADQLKACTSATPMRLYAIKGDKTYFIYDSEKKSGSSLKFTEAKNVNEAVKKAESYVELTAAAPTDYGYVQYAGSLDSDNDNNAKCYISLVNDNSGYLGVDSDRKLEVNGNHKTAWTVYLKSHVKVVSDYSYLDTINGLLAYYVSIFDNISYRQDPALWFNSDGLLYSDTSGSNDEYTEYAMYIGSITDITAITKDIKVGAGQTVRISVDGGVALQADCTLTIEKGGAALVESIFFNQGTIKNYGTLAVMDGGSIQPVYSDGGSFVCEGGDIVIMDGGRFMSGEDMSISKGSSIINRGIFLCGGDFTLNDATFITEDKGTSLFGYSILPKNFKYAKVNEINDTCISGATKLPSLTNAALGKISDTGMTISGSSKLINRGSTAIHQTISGSDKIANVDKGKLYYNK